MFDVVSSIWYCLFFVWFWVSIVCVHYLFHVCKHISSFVIFSASSSQLPKVSKKPPKAPVHAASSHTSQNGSVSLSTTPSPSYNQSPAPSYANARVTVNPRWLAVRLPPLKDIFNGSLPMFTSRRYQRQAKSQPIVSRSVDSGARSAECAPETKKSGRKRDQPKKFQDLFYWHAWLIMDDDL